MLLLDMHSRHQLGANFLCTEVDTPCTQTFKSMSPVQHPGLPAMFLNADFVFCVNYKKSMPATHAITITCP